MKNIPASDVPPEKILLLGDPGLRRISQPVSDFSDSTFKIRQARLQATLAAFRTTHGFGRAIAAPQIGIAQRFIAMNLGKGPMLIVNPEILWKSQEVFTMWDDCLSFPTLLVRVERHRSISVRFQDEQGESHEWGNLDQATSELLQHEMDHLDGILAIDRAIDQNAIILRETFDAQPAFFQNQVDYIPKG